MMRAATTYVRWVDALAAAALLILIVVGTLTSDTTEEVGQPKFGHIGQTIR